jgi:HD-GYP domain-containing protein (c-di-GMP phosphodiesterase class II)
MAFIPVESKDLRLGLYIRLVHKWSEHPFLRNAFKIKSGREIAIILNHKLTNIFYEPDRSDPEAVKQLKSRVKQAVREQAKEEVPDLEVAEEESILKSMKDARIQAFKRRRESIRKTERVYQKALHEGRTMIKNVSSGSEEGLNAADAIIESIINILNSGASETSLISQMSDIDTNSMSFMHALNVCTLSMTIGQELGLNRDEMHMMGLGALFHDVGMQEIPAKVRLKTGRLTKAEMDFIKLHPQYGRDIVRATENFPEKSIEVIYQHHEHLDGSGYPQGLTGDSISQMSRIVAVVNEYEKLTNDPNPKAKNYTPTEALGHFYKNMQKAFSPEVIVTLIQTLTVYPPGSIVKLNDDSIGMVIRINHQNRMKPMIVVHEPEISKEDAIIVDLAEDTDFTIEESLLHKQVSRETLKYLNPGNMGGYFLSERS